MAIIATNIDSVFDIIRKLRESNFEIVDILFEKSCDYFSIKIIRDDNFVKIIHRRDVFFIMSNFQKAIFVSKVLIFDDLSCEEIK